MPSHRFSLSETFNKSKKGKLKNIEKTQDHSDNYILYRKRFMMNFLLSLSLLLNGHYWISFSAITKELSIYFNKKESHINWFSNVFLLFPGFISLISVFLPNIIGLRWCLILGCLLHGSGTALRFSALFIIKEDLNLQFIICMLGSVILSFSQGVILNLPAYLSAKWFGVHERDISTAVACLSNLIGFSIGYLFPFLIMHLYIKKESYGFGLKIIVSSEFFFAIVVLLITCIFAENCPKTPPSKSECTIEEGMEAMSNKETMIFLIKQTMSLFKNIKISIFLIIYGVYYANTAITSMFLTEMNDFFNKDTNRISGYIGACCTLMGAFGTLFFAALVGKFGPKYNKHFSSYINFVCSLMTIVIIFINQKGLNNNYTIFVSMLLLGFHSDAFCSLGFEMLANISYPVQSNVSANAGLLVGNLIGAVLIPIFGIFSNHNKYLISLIFTASAYALNSILLTFLHFQNKRLHVDNEVMTTLT